MVLTSPNQELTEEERQKVDEFLKICQRRQWDKISALMTEWIEKKQYISLRAMLVAFEQTVKIDGKDPDGSQ
jgi:hypothetical protein